MRFFPLVILETSSSTWGLVFEVWQGGGISLKGKLNTYLGGDGSGSPCSPRKRKALKGMLASFSINNVDLFMS